MACHQDEQRPPARALRISRTALTWEGDRSLQKTGLEHYLDEGLRVVSYAIQLQHLHALRTAVYNIFTMKKSDLTDELGNNRLRYFRPK